MAARPNLQQPIEVLKLLGSPRVEETDAEVYDVYLGLSRTLTEPEQDAAAALGGAAKNPAGFVHLGDDQKHLVVEATTIEKVGQQRDSLKDLVSKIAADGEERRLRAVQDRLAADEDETGRQAERMRRRETAKGIHFG